MNNEQFIAYNSQTGEFEPTELRPSPKQLNELREAAARKTKYTKLHSPGDGWHYLPGPVIFALESSGRWFNLRETSEGCVFAHLEEICTLAGLDFQELCARAYPDEDIRVGDEDRIHCVRSATLNDVQAVIGDLDDINYGTLAHEVEKLVAAGFFDL